MNIESELLKIQDKVLKMGKLAIEHHKNLLFAFTQHSQEIAFQVIQEDEYINRYEEEINDLAQCVLALLTPVAKDLRMILASIKIVNDLERIGDYAKNIARQYIKNEALFDAILMDYIDMENHILKMLELSLNAYYDANDEACLEIIQMDKNINELRLNSQNKLIQDLQYSREHLFMFASILRNLERSGDHVKNICEHILFMVKGQHYDFG